MQKRMSIYGRRGTIPPPKKGEQKQKNGPGSSTLDPEANVSVRTAGSLNSQSLDCWLPFWERCRVELDFMEGLIGDVYFSTCISLSLYLYVHVYVSVSVSSIHPSIHPFSCL